MNGWTGLVESIVTTVQTSNAYRILAGEAVRPTQELPAMSREFRGAGDLKRLQRLTGIALQVGTNRVHASTVEALKLSRGGLSDGLGADR